MSKQSNQRMEEFQRRHILENKLRLWETPGFSQFLNDLNAYIGIEADVVGNSKTLKRLYENKLKELDEKDNKFKQTELDL